MMKILTLMFVAFIGTVALSACDNTFHGAGRDVQKVGQKMENPGPN